MTGMAPCDLLVESTDFVIGVTWKTILVLHIMRESLE